MTSPFRSQGHGTMRPGHVPVGELIDELARREVLGRQQLHDLRRAVEAVERRLELPERSNS